MATAVSVCSDLRDPNPNARTTGPGLRLGQNAAMRPDLMLGLRPVQSVGPHP